MQLRSRQTKAPESVVAATTFAAPAWMSDSAAPWDDRLFADAAAAAAVDAAAPAAADSAKLSDYALALADSSSAASSLRLKKREARRAQGRARAVVGFCGITGPERRSASELAAGRGAMVEDFMTKLRRFDGRQGIVHYGGVAVRRRLVATKEDPYGAEPPSFLSRPGCMLGLKGGGQLGMQQIRALDAAGAFEIARTVAARVLRRFDSRRRPPTRNFASPPR